MAFADIIRRLLGLTPQVGARPGAADHPAGRTETDRWQKALADFGYPYQLVSGVTAETTFRAEQELGAQQGFSPIIIAPSAWNSTPIRADERTRRALAQISERYDAAFGRTFITDRVNGLRRDFESDPDGPDLRTFDMLRPVAPQAHASGLLLLQRYNLVERAMQPVERVAIMRIPTTDSAWIPVYLGWGSWNAVPSPLEIAAVAHYWAATHGATLVAMTADQLEFSVTRPPASHGEAVALLQEHCAFAPETYEFDQDMLEHAAADLQVAKSWMFWWD